ncbi:MAG: ATP-binding protein [Alphaproteobacteria bacterium]
MPRNRNAGLKPAALEMSGTAHARRAVWLLSALAAVIVCGVWIAVWRLHADERASLVDDLRRDTQHAAHASADHIAHLMATVDQTLRYARLDYERDPANFNFGFWLDHVPAIQKISPQFSWIDARGLVRASSMGPMALGVSVADREHFKVHLAADTGEMFISAPLIGRTTGKLSMQLSRRINDVKGQFDGVLVFSIDPNVLADFFQTMRIGKFGHVVLLGPDDLVRAHAAPNGAPSLVSRTMQTLTHAEFAPNGPVRSLFGDGEVVRVVASVPGYKLRVVAEAVIADAWAHNARWRDGVLFGAAFISVVVVIVLAAIAMQMRAIGRARDDLQLNNRKLAEANTRATSALDAKSRFLANVSHELRTPLNAIIGFSEMMTKGFSGGMNARQADYVEHIHASGQHLLSLINDVLALSRLELRGYEVSLQPVDPRQPIADALRILSIKALQKGVELALELSDALPRVAADERAFKQVLLNLLSNAIKFTPKGGKVVLAAEAEPSGEVAFTVTDTGIGIPERELQRIFEPFHRVDGEGEGNAEGTGLGLTISLGLMALQGGRLEISSEVGKGTSVRAVLARWQASAQDAAQDVSRTPPADRALQADAAA